MSSIVISSSAFLAFNIVNMVKLPRELGIEVLIENANDYVWRHALQELVVDRPSEFTIHGPFLYMNLASIDCEFDQVIENYKWTFNYYNKYGAKHVVLHPHGFISNPQEETNEARKTRCLERINKLAELASQFGVNLLVENMCYPYIVFDQEAYVDIFNQIPSVNSLIDVGHCLIKSWDIPKLLKDLGSRINAFHIDDNYGPNQKDIHLKLGAGVLDYQEFFDAYNLYCPNSRLVLEYLGVSVEEIVNSANLVKTLVK